VKIALGTAQFGLDYGIANRTGRVADADVAAILDIARAAGIDTIDTAIAYGDAERRLGEAGVTGFRIVSKLPAAEGHGGDLAAWARRAVEGSLERLRVSSLGAVLLHRPAQILEPAGRALYDALTSLRDDGLTDKIGISVYGPGELDALAGFDFDVVQAPFSVLDRRLLRSGWLDRLDRDGVEVHSRSVFLQGLLLMPPSQRPAAFARWSHVWRDYDEWVRDSGLPALNACLRFATSVPGIARVVVGVDSAGQLAEIVAAAWAGGAQAAGDFDSTDPDLVEPSRWQVPA
jgi:aryl-alcohol dehydrogenase-like predicted oxidoreductase